MHTTNVSAPKQFSVDKAIRSRAICKICKKKCVTGEIRIAKFVPDLLGTDRKKNWYHVDCIFKQFFKQRPSTKRIQCLQDLDGLENISKADQKMIKDKIEKSEKTISKKCGVKKMKKSVKDTEQKCLEEENIKLSDTDIQLKKMVSFQEFHDVVNAIQKADDESEKYAIAQEIVKKEKGINRNFKIKLWCKYLLPHEFDRRPYALTNEEFCHIFSSVFHMELENLCQSLVDTEDFPNAIMRWFITNEKYRPNNISTITLEEIDSFLDVLSDQQHIEAYTQCFDSIISKCTALDLKILICIIRREMKIDITLDHILKSIHPDAFEVYKTFQDLNTLLEIYCRDIQPSIPFTPMEAQPCLSFKDAQNVYRNGMLCSVNFEGQKIQVHKKDSEFLFFPAKGENAHLSSKTEYFKTHLSNAFPFIEELILDCELILVSSSGKLQAPRDIDEEKAAALSPSEVCLLVNDCLYCEDDITSKPLRERLEILRTNMTEIPLAVIMADMKEVRLSSDLNKMIHILINHDLECLFLKDIDGAYEPSVPSWSEIHRESFLDDKTGYTLELTPLGAWSDSESTSETLSTFLMCCYDPGTKLYYTVAKLSIDGDSEFSEAAQKLKMIRIHRDHNKIPSWLSYQTADVVPDYIAEDPQVQPVWRLRGLEFAENEFFTSGIELRYTDVLSLGKEDEQKLPIDLETVKQLRNSKQGGEFESVAGSSRQAGEWYKRKDITPDYSVLSKRSRVEYKEENLSNGTIVHVFPLNYIPSLQLFKGISILLHKSVKGNCNVIVRNFMRFGGIVVWDYYRRRATHCLHLNDEEPEGEMCRHQQLIHVHPSWIVDSIEQSQKLDDRLYRVYLTSAKEPTDDLERQRPL